MRKGSNVADILIAIPELHLPVGRSIIPRPVTAIPPQLIAAYRERMRQHIFFTSEPLAT